MTRKSKVVYAHTKEDKDGSTELMTIKRIVESPDKFFKVFIEDLAPLINCTNAEKNFIICCHTHQFIEYETNEIVLTASRRDKVAECSGITERSVQNIIYKLVAKEIIMKYDKGFYLNPKFFFTGSEQARAKLLKLTMEYHIKQPKNRKK